MTCFASGQCQCGQVKISIDTQPFLSYNCHCSHCRGFASKHAPEPAAYHGGGAVWKWNVKVDGDMDYEPSTSLGGLFAMERGRCSSCKQPVWESGERLILPFAMVMSKPVLDFEPDTDIFYDSGLKGGTTGDVVIRSDLGSLLYEVYLIAFKAIPLIPWSLYKRVTRPSPSVKSD